MAEKTDPRYEIKMSLDPRLLPEVRAWVRLHPAQWRAIYAPRWVNNLYFDSLRYAGLRANLIGLGTRAKLRLRWYGDDLARVAAPHLELKRKQGKVGWKEFCALDLVLDLKTLPWADVHRTLAAAAPGARPWLEGFAFPALINRYHRAYYATPDGEVRLTVDSGLGVYDQRRSQRPNLRRPARLTPWITVEIKADVTPRVAQRLSDIVAQFPLRAGRFSKYVHGMQAVGS